MADTKTLQKISDVFAMFHDGGIIHFEGDNSFLRLTIQCDYLAVIIHPDYQFFYLELINITKFDLDAWQNPVNLAPFILIGFRQALKATLQIGYANVTGDHVSISCRQDDDDFNYCGGNLMVRCEELRISDQDSNELTIEGLAVICNSYWSRHRKQ